MYQVSSKYQRRYLEFYLQDWVNDLESEQKVLWIHGLVGSGKSALSTTITNTFRDSRELDTFLFFDSDVTERSNPTIVIRTLAYQLGTSDSNIGTAICMAIKKNPNVIISPLSYQFLKLLLEPLSKLEFKTSTVIIVLDTLNECGTADECEALLGVLAQDLNNLPFVAHIIITSHAEIDIHTAFELQDYILTYKLDITSPRNSNDILTICVWDSTTGVELKEIWHGIMVWSVALSPDGQRIFSRSNDGIVRVWDARSGTELFELFGHNAQILLVDLSPDGSRIVSGSRDKIIRVWDVTMTSAGGLLTIRGHWDSVTCVAFSPDGKQIASGSQDKTVSVWDAERGATVFPALQGHEKGVNSVKFSADRKRLVSGSADKIIRVWDSASGLQTSVLQGHLMSVSCIAFSADGRRVISGSYDETIRVWDVITGSQVSELHGLNGGSIQSNTTIQIWDITSDTEEFCPALRGHNEYVSCIAFSLDGCRIVLGSFDGTIIIWDAISGALLCHPHRGHAGWVRSAAFSMDGSCIITRSDNGTIFYDAASCDQLHNHLSIDEFNSSFPDSIKITGGGWIVDSVAGSTIFQLPRMVLHSSWAYMGHRWLLGRSVDDCW
ncbi:hypothetical protein PILCRDRAFT_6386 [Piloderma croceum F 1598]|uniref:Nephrocystin 3-like N-terminal domain-containing protein n=1 Tax=Piloderma croceum (strain F 1598) TaxID=765440 RepID=A0A0C3C3C7_PILCF|nr:hypothetical protein PILCRDRAFT_6386 [Piloderma croceum F 1598]